MIYMNTLPALDTLISLKGRRALITGAAAGIGKAIAVRFAEAGAALELVDLDTAGLTTVQNDLAGCSGGVQTHEVNLARKEAVTALWTKLQASPPDILVNNAGIYPIKPFLDVDEAFLQRVMDTNLHSVYWMCQEMISRREKQGGIIINIGSIEAVQPFKDDMAHYSVSKAGVIALTRALAREHARHGFRVNAILPGGIVTPGTVSVAKQVFKLKLGLLKTGYDYQQRLPMGRFGQPDEVARIALVLASDLASYVHGSAIPVDGGFLAA